MIKFKVFVYRATVSGSVDKCHWEIARWQKENGIKDDAIISISATEDGENGFLKTKFLVTYSE